MSTKAIRKSLDSVSLEDAFGEKEMEVYSYDRRERKLDPGTNIVRKRKWWFQIW